MLPKFTNHPEKILLVRMDNLGDVVMLTPAMRALQKAFPETRLTLLASPAGSQMAPLLPWIDETLVWSAVWQDVSGSRPLDPARELELVDLIHEKGFDAALIFTSFSQSPFPPAYCCSLAGVPVRVGFSKEFGGAILTHAGRPPEDSGHQVDRNLALLSLVGIPDDGLQMELDVPADVVIAVDALLTEHGVKQGAAYIVVAPGASCAARRYPLERFALAIDRLHEQTGLPVVILGSQKEQAGFEPLEEAHREPWLVPLAGKTSVGEMVEIIHRAELVIANNSASLHIADAFRVPQVILYSGTEYRSQWMPRFSPAVLLKRETSCSPCYRFDCPFELECLDVPPEEVASAALSLIQHHGRSMSTLAEPLSVVNEPILLVEKNGPNTQGNQTPKKYQT
jgi:ADP-heptose:LPS heptosyltransferase